MITGFAFSTFAFATMAGSSVQAGPIVPPGRYCMTWDIGGSDCSFTSYAQCLATASGLDAECYGATRDVPPAKTRPFVRYGPFPRRAATRSAERG